MCEFCVKHGEGKKWYLQVKNYSEELYNKLQVEKFVHNFLKNFDNEMRNNLKKLEKVNNYPPLIKNFIKRAVLNAQKKIHYGQVVPIEDVEKILELTSFIVRLTCVCRKFITGKERRYCFGLNMKPVDSGLANELNVEVLDKKVAFDLIKELEQKGLYHSIWTFKTPFIGAICNCDYDCVAYKTTIKLEYPSFFKSEYVAKIDFDKCIGCKNCKKFCQFNAIYFSLTINKCIINEKLCFGCGICRIVCENNAISLVDRSGFY